MMSWNHKKYVYKNYRKSLLNVHFFMEVSVALMGLPNIKSSATVYKGYEKKENKTKQKNLVYYIDALVHLFLSMFFPAFRSPVRPETTGRGL